MRCKVAIQISLILLAFGSAVAVEDPLLEDQPPYSLIIFCSRNAENYDVKIAAANKYGQVMLLGRASSTQGIGFMRVGERMTSGTAAKIINQVNGLVSFDFITTTFGASIVVGGEDGKIHSFDELPKGLHQPLDHMGYLLFGKMAELKDLPLDQQGLAEWADAAKVQALIDQGRLIMTRPVLKTERSE